MDRSERRKHNNHNQTQTERPANYPQITQPPFPHSIEIEQAVLARMLQSSADCNYVLLAGVQSSDFYRTLHQQIFETIITIGTSDIELSVLYDRLIHANTGLTEQELLEYLNNLIGYWLEPTCNIQLIVSELLEYSRRRRILARLYMTTEQLAKGTQSSIEAVNDLINEIRPIVQCTLSQADIISFEQLICSQPPPLEYIIDPIVPSHGLTMLTGEPGSYKSWLVYSMALAIAGGFDWLGQFRTTRTGVLVYDVESDAALLRNRLTKLFLSILTYHDSSISSSLPLYIAFRPCKLDDQLTVQEIMHYTANYGVQFVVVDPLIHSLPDGCDENSSRGVAYYFERARQLVRDTGITWLFVHHSRKRSLTQPSDPSQMIRGSTAIRGVLDSSLYVAQTSPGIVTIQHDKSRRHTSVPPFVVEIRDSLDGNLTNILYRGSGDIVSTEVQLAKRDIIALLKTERYGLPRANIIQHAKAVGVGTRTADAALQYLVAEGIIAKRREGRQSIYYYQGVSDNDNDLELDEK